MTVSRVLEITCNECYETERFNLDVLRDRKIDSILDNRGYVKDHKGLLEGTDHYCPDCNDREKETFYVYGGRGEEFLDPVQAWGIVDARQVAWDEFEVENMVKREKQEVPL